MTRIIEASQGEVVAIAIGPSKTIFRIHKSLLCSKSEYFRTAYNGRWKDSTDGVVLEDVDVSVFKIFVNWLYTSEMPEDFDDLSSMTGMPNGVEGESTAAAFLLLKACVFGDRFLAYDFYQRAHNTFVDWNVLNPGWPWVTWEMVDYAFENLADDTPLLAMMVDLQCVYWKRGWKEEKELFASLRKDFLFKAMLRSIHFRENPMEIGDMKECEFHVHPTEAEREWCQNQERERFPET